MRGDEDHVQNDDAQSSSVSGGPAAKGLAGAVAHQQSRDSGAKEGRRRDIKLNFLIHDVSRMRRTAFDEMMKPLRVTRSQWWVLAHLSRHDGMMQTQLADMLDVGRASLGTIVDRLEAEKWVERRPDPVDRRAKRIFLTRESKGLLEVMQTAEGDFNDRVLEKLSDSDRDVLIELLTVMKDALTRMNSK
jgi:MarR family transcriptional regulator for hemolysin